MVVIEEMRNPKWTILLAAALVIPVIAIVVATVIQPLALNTWEVNASNGTNYVYSSGAMMAGSILYPPWAAIWIYALWNKAVQIPDEPKAKAYMHTRTHKNT